MYSIFRKKEQTFLVKSFSSGLLKIYWKLCFIKKAFFFFFFVIPSNLRQIQFYTFLKKFTTTSKNTEFFVSRQILHR